MSLNNNIVETTLHLASPIPKKNRIENLLTTTRDLYFDNSNAVATYDIEAALTEFAKLKQSDFDSLDTREDRDTSELLDDSKENLNAKEKLNLAIDMLEAIQELTVDIPGNNLKKFSDHINAATIQLEDIEESECEKLKKPMPSSTISMASVNTTDNTTDPNTLNTTIKYAPVKPIKSGKFVLDCSSLIWNNAPSASKAQLTRMGKEVAKTYEKLSNGAVEMMVRVRTYRTGLPKSRDNVNAATKKVKNLFGPPPEGYRQLFLTVNNKAKKRSHAGGNNASLLTPLITTAKHEVGHILKGNGIPILKHSNRWGWEKKGNGRNKRKVYVFQSSRDGSSFMSIYPAYGITAIQKYQQGWYGEKQVAMYEKCDPATVYNIQLVDAPEKTDRVNGVLVPRTEGQSPLFISLYERQLPGKKNKGQKQRLMALHTGEGGGSTRLEAFGNHLDTKEGFSVDVLEKLDDYWRVSVTPNIPESECKGMSRR